ncbi:MAG TPA: hypothetical protein VKY60_06650 [Burkholderiaceae bacterium]|jgi:uncharacterized membrane protein|nr:hypothetical protein [Burkholderiaceae bacterium]
MTADNPQRPEIIEAQVIQPADNEALKSMRTYSMIVYGLYTLGLFLGGLPTLVGLIMAYVKRNDFTGTIYREHMGLLIRTFWYSLLFSFIGAILTWLYIGFVILFAVGVWYVYRLVRGFVRMHDGKGVW